MPGRLNLGGMNTLSSSPPVSINYERKVAKPSEAWVINRNKYIGFHGPGI